MPVLRANGDWVPKGCVISQRFHTVVVNVTSLTGSRIAKKTDTSLGVPVRVSLDWANIGGKTYSGCWGWVQDFVKRVKQGKKQGPPIEK